VCLGRLVAASGRPRNFIVRRPKLRLWTLHPKYLDAKGLVALWREGLLARTVLRGATKGYRHHPQLERFRAHASPRAAINIYLKAVAIEAEKRGYLFDRQKIGPGRRGVTLGATQGQLAYEWKHLLRKLKARSPRVYARWRKEAHPQPHPLFEIVRGGVESWERKRV
jgi:Pyrimidine dimer DNA glycosylase